MLNGWPYGVVIRFQTPLDSCFIHICRLDGLHELREKGDINQVAVVCFGTVYPHCRMTRFVLSHELRYNNARRVDSVVSILGCCMETYEARRLTRGAIHSGCWLVWVFSAAAQSGNFQQDPLVDGVVSLEAEHFHTSTTVNGQSWVVVTTNQASGGQVVVASPNLGTRNNEGYDVSSPRLDYRVNFVKTGIHYVVGRGSSPSGDDDSFHVGLDGVPNLTSDRIFGFYSVPQWRGDTMGQYQCLLQCPLYWRTCCQCLDERRWDGSRQVADYDQSKFHSGGRK